MSNDALKAAEGSVAHMIGSSFSGAPAASEPPAATGSSTEEIQKFEFDEIFQTKIAALALRDNEFMRRAAHLLKPEYFENVGEAALVNLALKHFEKYRNIPDATTLVSVIRDAVQTKVIRKDVAPLVVEARKRINSTSMADREYVEDKLVEFARHQAVSAAILKSVELLDKKQFPKIEAAVRAAIDVGLNQEGDAYDYFGKIAERSEERIDFLAGKRPPTGVTTGILKMDDLLYHKGWGRGELATIMGGAKSGKTTALINFAKSAALKGHNVLVVTLEVSARIYSERLDACITDTMVKELANHVNDVRSKIESIKSGKLLIHEYPSGTLKPSMLRSLLERYRNRGQTFDLVVVDYADIMAPEMRTDNAIENSKTVYVDLRAIAQEFWVAMLTATQTNREGYKATVAKAEHVAEDFNKVRTVDLMISINATEEERRNGEARLYFAASRNQEGGFTIFIKQNLAMMKFVESVIKVE